MAAFPILLIVDFEATCDEGDNPVVTRDNQEIIEFPWIVLSLEPGREGEILDKQQLYIRPTYVTKLPAFCTKLTGITDEVLEAKGLPSLAHALEKFHNYVQEHILSKGKTFCLLTDGEWDLKVCLRAEALKKQLIVQDYFNVFFDLKKEFNKCFFSPSKKPTLQKMLQLTGQEFVGRAHSGMDDCVNIARVVQALLRENHVFTDPEHIDREYDPSRDPTLVDFNRTRPQSLSSCVLRMRGLPYSATVDDVRAFFEPVIPAEIVLVSTTDGRPSGTGYARFASVEDTQCALQKDRQYIGTRYIELFAASSAEWEGARAGCH